VDDSTRRALMCVRYMYAYLRTPEYGTCTCNTVLCAVGRYLSVLTGGFFSATYLHRFSCADSRERAPSLRESILFLKRASLRSLTRCRLVLGGLGGSAPGSGWGRGLLTITQTQVTGVPSGSFWRAFSGTTATHYLDATTETTSTQHALYF
jgi:hypothetical protein